MSQLTTHILDTTIGKPAQGVEIILYGHDDNIWLEIKRGFTNADGRITDLLQADLMLKPGMYKMRFETAVYFGLQSIQTFYPFVEIVFSITTHEHYHIPLLLNPFGYSTYRGS